MSERNIELALHWLRKADNDLITARQTLLLPDGPTDTVCFHAQQAVEKAVKSLLTCHGIRAPRIHDLTRLLELALPILPALEKFREHFAQMSAYAVEVRYPDDCFEPPRSEASEALRVAVDVVMLVREQVRE